MVVLVSMLSLTSAGLGLLLAGGFWVVFPWLSVLLLMLMLMLSVLVVLYSSVGAHVGIRIDR